MTSARRPTLLRAAAALLGALALAVPGVARAQADINPPLTSALLLVDTSGSMEYQADGSEVTCNPASVSGVNDKSRWTDVIEVLTGTIDNYTCQSIVRTDATTFKIGEYAPGIAPYDYLYPIPYHRPLSAGCAPAPGVQSSNPFIYPASGAINYHRYDSAASCTFSQRGNDGLLDAFRNDVRFALMTFDTATDSSTGFSGAMANAVTDTPGGQKGLWSYVPVTSAK
ncbi:MAG TPA: hypothetical protein VGQ57_14915, partial [Polyangiaceae bacterium]|nr:hypothetical protein [Polyangiaceae bacterium]